MGKRDGSDCKTTWRLTGWLAGSQKISRSRGEEGRGANQKGEAWLLQIDTLRSSQHRSHRNFNSRHFTAGSGAASSPCRPGGSPGDTASELPYGVNPYGVLSRQNMESNMEPASEGPKLGLCVLLRPSGELRNVAREMELPKQKSNHAGAHKSRRKSTQNSQICRIFRNIHSAMTHRSKRNGISFRPFRRLRQTVDGGD